MFSLVTLAHQLNQILTKSCKALLGSGEKSGAKSPMKSLHKIKDESFLFTKSRIFVLAADTVASLDLLRTKVSNYEGILEMVQGRVTELSSTMVQTQIYVSMDILILLVQMYRIC